MPSCNHDEADTWLVKCISHELELVLKRTKVCIIDTDVIVIYVGAFIKLIKGQLLDDIWIAFGIDEDLRVYSINAICATHGDSYFQIS